MIGHSVSAPVLAEKSFSTRESQSSPALPSPLRSLAPEPPSAAPKPPSPENARETKGKSRTSEIQDNRHRWTAEQWQSNPAAKILSEIADELIATGKTTKIGLNGAGGPVTLLFTENGYLKIEDSKLTFSKFPYKTKETLDLTDPTADPIAWTLARF